MDERREYPRLKLNVDGLFILQNENIVPRDFEGTLVDISEGGFKVAADYSAFGKTLDNVSVGDIIHFSIPDEYQLFGEEIASLITGLAKVLRKYSEDGKVFLGCKYLNRDSEIDQYVSDRRTTLFMKTIHRNK